jgi:GAF domain-containing protein
VAIYERSYGAYRLLVSSDGVVPSHIDSDDPVFVRLRKSLSDVDLSTLSSALGARGYAFPLSVRGRLFGALACGPREEDEPYAADELALLHHVAREVGAELHLIRSRDLSQLAREIADGKVTQEEARQRARELTMTSEWE